MLRNQSKTRIWTLTHHKSQTHTLHLVGCSLKICLPQCVYIISNWDILLKIKITRAQDTMYRLCTVAANLIFSIYICLDLWFHWFIATKPFCSDNWIITIFMQSFSLDFFFPLTRWVAEGTCLVFLIMAPVLGGQYFEDVAISHTNSEMV